MKTKRQSILYLALTMVMLMTGICNLWTADAAETLTDAEKSSAYGFFVWLSENADDASDREDAAVAAQLLKGTVSSSYQAQVFNDGSISATGATRVSYDTILTQTSLGSENDATSLACVREAVDYIKLGNSYRALENLPALNVSSALMAMSELNANYQHALYTDMNADIEHTIAFNALENLATCWDAGSRDFSVPSYDPYDKHTDGGVTYDGWYYGEKEKYEAGQTSQAGHYMTLTDRNNNKKMLVTGFGYTNRKRTESGWITITQYFSQHFSDDSTLYSIGSGITPDEYLTYLNRYDCYLNGHKWNEGTVTVEPACLTEGEKSFTCTVCGETKTETIAALGHDWEAPTYTWAEDNSSVTAERICKNDKKHEHTETETVKTTSAVTTAAVCTKDGETTYTAVFENEAFEEQKKTVADIPALSHDWDTPVYTWADDNSTCTAARTCKHDAAHIDTETAKAEAKVTKPATCLEPGDTTYTAAFNSKAFTAQTKTVTDIPALGHDWEAPTYTWAEDNSSVTAERICKNDKEHEHTETETANTTSAVTTAAVCTKDGETTYTAVFENEAFEEQKKTVADIPALNHDWDTPVYTWADDNSTCTAARTCKHDAAHIDTETAKAEAKVTKPATCLEPGDTTYTAAFNSKAFTTQTKTVTDILALGHDWEAPTYTWAEDNSSVTAERICKNDKEHEHTETETVKTTSVVTTAAVCTKDGETTYTAVFENEAFEEQKKTVADIPALSHDWDTPVYTWAEDNSTCTAARTCKHDASHIDTETAKAEAKVTKPATCLEPGDTTYTAAFNSKAFTGQTKTVTDIPALGHDWEAPTYTWAEDNSSVTAERICKNDKEHEHTETETVNTISAVTTAAVCTKDGETTYTAVFENEAFEEQKKTVANIPALSHDWDTPVYTWAEDNSTCTAARTCKHDAAHIETETVTPASKESKPGTCIEDGENTFTAEFTNDVFETQIKTVSFTGEHSWSEWTDTTEPTTTREGIKTRVCSICRKSETELIPRLPEPETNAPSDTGNKQEDSASAGNQTSDGTGTAAGQETAVDDTAGGQNTPDVKTTDQQTPAVTSVSQKADDGSAVGKGASAQAAETAILRIASEEGPTGTTFGLLSARVKKVKNTSITLTWNRIAKSYIIFGNKCGKGNKFEKIQTVNGNSFTQKGLKKGTYYKYMVMAVDSGGKVVATSKTLHAATSGKRAGNPKKVSVKKKTLKIKKGKTAKISASIVKPNGKTVKNHRKLAYESADTKVAVVSKKGKVKAVGKGTTTIYVYAQNGVYAKVRITVK